MTRPIRAGAAWAAKHPELLARLQAAIAEAAPELAALAGELGRAAEADRAAWLAKYGEPRPETLRDWFELGSRAGISGERLLAGDERLADVAAVCVGYLRRLADARAGHPPEASAAAPKSKSKRTKGGRPRLSEAETARRLSVLAELERATGAGVATKDFCDGKPYGPATLGKWKSWAAQRKRRA